MLGLFSQTVLVLFRAANESEPVMIELVMRQVEPEIVAKLKERADQHCHSVEDELRQILKDAVES